jgi:hypothetical protein
MSTQIELDWQLFLSARTGDLIAGREALANGANPRRWVSPG